MCVHKYSSFSVPYIHIVLRISFEDDIIIYSHSQELRFNFNSPSLYDDGGRSICNITT